MKPVFIVAVIVLLLTGTQCTTIQPASQNPNDDVTVIRVECTNQRSIRSNVLMLLKQGRVSDWVFRDLGPTEEIEARYVSIHPAKAEHIKEMLMQTAGVITVEIRKDGLPVRNIR